MFTFMNVNAVIQRKKTVNHYFDLKDHKNQLIKKIIVKIVLILFFNSYLLLISGWVHDLFFVKAPHTEINCDPGANKDGSSCICGALKNFVVDLEFA